MMTLYKVCLTLIALASVGVTARSFLDDITTKSLDHQRSRRSSNDDDDDDEKNVQQADSREDHTSSLQAGYRFGDEFFYPAASTQKNSPVYERNTDGCERIVKDSMICMLCKDPKTNSKYEQCSYVSRPKDRGYYTEKSYKSPSSHDNRNNVRKEDIEEERKKKDDDHDDSDDDSYSSRESFDESSRDHYDDDRRETAATAPANSRFTETNQYKDDRINEKNVDNDDCRRIVKNSKICTICKNRKTGDDYESCSSGLKNHRTNDDDDDDDDAKVYNYGQFENYRGYPGKNERNDETEESPSPSSLYRSIGYQQDDTNERGIIEKKRNDNARKRNDKNNGNKSKGCKQIEKDSMTCTVCVNPETGGNFEKCSYTHQPNDKVYKFSKSKTFGYPENAEDDETNGESRR